MRDKTKHDPVLRRVISIYNHIDSLTFDHIIRYILVDS